MKKKSNEIHASKPSDRSRCDSLSREQISAIVTSANSDPSMSIVRDVMQVVLHTGLLSSQLSNLRISDVDIENLRLRLDSHSSFSEQRFIPLSPMVLVALMHLHDLNPESEFVLGDNRSARISFVRRSLRQLGEQTGNRHLRLHSFRSTFAAMMVSAGVDISTRAQLMGHSLAKK
jgi:integrase